MGKRKSITKSVRFEVFKRDSFTCQYCGKSAPDVVLEVDHIIPVSKGGDNDISNLITACFDCNRGKSNKKLTENQTLKLQKEELDKLNKRREQLEMMAKWRIELLNIEHEEVNKLMEIVNLENSLNISLTNMGIKRVINLIKKYGFNEVLECSLISFRQYDPETAIKKIEPIIRNRKLQKDNPELKDLHYIKGIAKNRFDYFDPKKAFLILKNGYDSGIPIEELKAVTLECKNWSEWKDTIEYYWEE